MNATHTFLLRQLLPGLLTAGLFGLRASAGIVSISESGGDAGRFAIIEPTGSPNGSVFQEDAWMFTDRTHEWNGPAFDAAGNLSTAGTTIQGLPPYLIGHPYIANANNHRDNAAYMLTITVDSASEIYLLIDNRVGDGANGNPPTLGSGGAGLMPWVADMGFVQVNTGRSPNGQPDFVAADEGSALSTSDPAARTHNATVGPGVGLNQFATVYRKTIPAGVITLLQQNNGSLNMYGVVVVSIAPPSTPANLAAVNGDNKVSLTWSASSGAQGYIVKRSLIAGGPYDNIATNASPGYVDSTAVNGLTYFYVVSAFNAAGETPNSNEAIGEPKPAPSGVLAIGGTNQAEVRWNALVGANTYTVKRSSASGGPYTTLASGLTDTNYVDIGLLNGRFYYYVVIAQLLVGGDGGQSDEAAGLTAAGAPAGAASLLAATVIKLTWATTDPVLSSFAIEESADGVNFAPRATVAGSARTYLATGLSIGATYHYRIQAANATGPSGYSAPVSASTPTYGLNVNFANPTLLTNFPGYFNDYGTNYGLRPNGMNYGWDVDNVANARERNSVNSPDKRYDTFNHLQKPLPAGRSWEIEIPNGFYQVHFVAGDPDNVDSVFQHNIEGEITQVRIPGGGTNFFDFTKTVIVDDGRLTIGNGPFATNSKICFVDIYATTATPPVIGTHPQPVTVEEHHAATFTVTMSGGSEPFRYQWLHDDMAIPGANGPTLTLSEALMADAGAYKVAVSNYAGAVTSDTATLRVVADTNPPVVVSAVSLDGLTVTICFSEKVDKESAEDPFNYVSDNGVISAALQADGRTVIITLGSPVSDTFSVVVNTIPDLAGVPINSVTVSGRVVGITGEDINAPTLAGSHYSCDGSTFVITGGGNPFTGAADQLHFVYCTVQGDFEVRVRVADLAISNVYARAMLMVRESTGAGSRHATLSVNAPQPGRDLGEPIARGTAGGNNGTWGVNFSPAGIPVWLRITRAGNTLTGYRGADGLNWTQVAQATIALPTGLLVGMGVNSHDPTTLATGTFTDFRINWLTPAPTIMNPVYNAGVFSGSFSSTAGISYNVQYKDDLTAPSWTTLTTLGGTGSPVPFSDPGPPSSTGLRVYRVRLR